MINPDLKLAAVYDSLESKINAVTKQIGPKGDTGAQGPQGPQGPQGIPGKDGVPGRDGRDGKDGTDGKDGEAGPEGLGISSVELDIDGHLVCTMTDGSTIDAGSLDELGAASGTKGSSVVYSSGGGRGEQGETGPQGPQGETGAQGPQGIQGAAGPQGPAGSDGQDGQDGAQGPQGIQGATGPQGPAGADGGVSELVADTSPQLGGNLDVNGQDIVTTSNGDIDLDPNGSGVVVFKGNATKGAGQFKLNCENNSHGITIKGPPHSAAASYTLTLPNTDGNADQVLKTDGSGGLSWVDPTAGATGPQGPQGETGPQGPAGPAGSGSTSSTLTVFGRTSNIIISSVFNRAGTSVLNSASSSTLVAVSRTATTAITQILNRSGSSVIDPSELTTVTARSGDVTLQNADLFVLQSRSSNLTLKATGTFFVVAGRTQNHLVGI